jgi:hypothetical protein
MLRVLDQARIPLVCGLLLIIVTSLTLVRNGRDAALAAPRGVTVASPTPASTLNPTFSTILSKLKSGTQVPVMLPAVIVATTPLYANIDEVDSTDYTVGLSIIQNCNGIQYCQAGFIQSLPSTGSIDFTNQLNIVNATLANGLQAYLAEPPCGASCNPPYIKWISNGREYSISMTTY